MRRASANMHRVTVGTEGGSAGSANKLLFAVSGARGNEDGGTGRRGTTRDRGAPGEPPDTIENVDAKRDRDFPVAGRAARGGGRGKRGGLAC